MIKKIRSAYNNSFQIDDARQIRQSLEKMAREKITFPLSLMPLFLSRSLISCLTDAVQQFFTCIKTPAFMREALQHVPKEYRPTQDFTGTIPQLSCYDFAMGLDSSGRVRPYLLECQGFSTLYGVIPLFGKMISQRIPGSSAFIGFDSFDEFLAELRHVLGGAVLIDVDPKSQKFRTDFSVLERYAGVEVRDLTHENVQTLNGRPVYNRCVPIEAIRAGRESETQLLFNGKRNFVVHPAWFWMVSKGSLPEFSKVSNLVPHTEWLTPDVARRLVKGEFILKPVDDFGGSGVKLDPTIEDISEALLSPEHFIVQEKINLAPVVEAPDGGEYFCEVRVVCLGETPAFALARIAESRMLNVGFNAKNPFCGMTIGLVCEDGDD